MLTPVGTARLSRCVTTRQLKELAQLSCVICDQQYVFTAQTTTGKNVRQKQSQPGREWRDPITLSALLTGPHAHRSLNSI